MNVRQQGGTMADNRKAVLFKAGNSITWANLSAWASFLDGIGNAAGYGVILIIVAFFRELLGSGTIWDYPVLERIGLYNTGYVNNGLMILPPMALITVGIIIWIQRARKRDLIEPN